MRLSRLLVASIAIVAIPAAQAQESDQWIWRIGVHSVQPKSDNGSLVNVDSAATLTFNGTYMLTSSWGIELLAALPFSHDINLNGGDKVAETKHLPPTLSLQYHFNSGGTVRPYIGAGLNYTLFFSEETSGALAGTELELEPSFGPAAQLGIDIAMGVNWAVNVDMRWMDIDTDANLNGAFVGNVEIDPYAFGVSIGRRF
ncbi:MAG: outer membrane beta-barrel protein [Candidatus Obscuribacterales bacterium]|nr:outer membrane beta-barrel protein [Steroidobacteraceae bacterium]